MEGRASDDLSRGAAGGAGFEFRGSRPVRDVSATHPNNGMHPTADTLPLIYLQRLGAAGDAGR
jgi:hypothetical protein